TPGTSRPPNLIVILADDLGYGDICAYGCASGRTPHIDALARSGVRFTQGYVTAPVCSPSRAALMTGRYQQRFGHEFNPGGGGRDQKQALGTPVSERLFPQYLKERGYATGMVGKWHLGALPQFLPLARGFDEFFGFSQAAHLYLDPATPNVHYVDRGGRSRGTPLRVDPQNPILRGNEPVEEKEYLTEAFTREAVSFIERHQAEPFFLYVAYNAPHTPLQVTDRYYDRFPQIADEGHRIFAAMVSALDDGVGEITAALERAGLAERTLVVFSSDNGCATYTEACSNGPLLGGKLTFFEGGVRVPFVAAWPGTIPSGMVIDVPVSTLDLLPTALELAGAEAPTDRPLDGRSLMALVRGEAGADGHDQLVWRNGKSWAVRDGSWKLIRYDGEPPFLFDLASDPTESKNVASSMSEREAALERVYRAWEAGAVAPLWTTRKPLYTSLQEIVEHKPMRLLETPEADSILIDF
ncbi:MAG TPA: sulfatase-like hydrolase/transferase, partial [Thermoanaerobaculia bacterium]|nr:sulfatase-like hydrolase/transferase [Thermoanaerobaculia bacterium]